MKLEKRVTAGWRPRWDSFLRHVALVYLSKLDVDGGPHSSPPEITTSGCCLPLFGGSDCNWPPPMGK